MTNPPYTTIANALLSALERFDHEIAPQGLYAAEEHRVKIPRPRWELEWTDCIKPTLKASGAIFTSGAKLHMLQTFQMPKNRLRQEPYGATTDFKLPDLGRIDLTLIRTSKIKVRLFGDTFRIDPHPDFSDRWAKLPLTAFLRQYRKDSSLPRRSMLLLLGFDKHHDPLGKELVALQDKRKWEKYGWTFHTHSWADPHKRAFFTRAAIWTPQE